MPKKKSLRAIPMSEDQGSDTGTWSKIKSSSNIAFNKKFSKHIFMTTIHNCKDSLLNSVEEGMQNNTTADRIPLKFQETQLWNTNWYGVPEWQCLKSYVLILLY